MPLIYKIKAYTIKIHILLGLPNHIDWHPKSGYLGVALGHGTVKIYEIRMHKLIQHYRLHSGPVCQVTFHPDGNWMLTSSSDGTVKVI